MGAEREITLQIDEETKLVVVAEQIGPALVSDDVVARLANVTQSIERVSAGVLDSLKRIQPTSAAVELGFGLAIEGGQLVALFGKAKGEATIKVTLEWNKAAEAAV